MENRPRILLAEVQPGEEEYLQEHFPRIERYLPETTQEIDLAEWRDVEILSLFVHCQLTEVMLEQLPKLRMVAARSTGYDQIDLEAADARGIVVSNVPSYGENTVAEHTFALILSLSRKIHKAYQRTIAGDFSLVGLEGFDLNGKTLGVVGAGSIGLHVIRIAKGFGMKVIAYDVHPNKLIAEVLDFEYCDLDCLLTKSDIITLHAPYLPATHHMINSDSIKLIKRGALLINTARGGLVDTAALLAALDEGILSGAGLDVMEGEELMDEEDRLVNADDAGEKLRLLLRRHMLLRRQDVVISPHMAFFSKEALQRILETTVENILAFEAGKAQNVVNHPRAQGDISQIK